MRAYIAYDRNIGSEEYAFLVFHHNVKEAKKLAWSKCPADIMSYIDLEIRWVRNPEIFALGDQEKLAKGEPHFVTSPTYCKGCNQWGNCLTGDYLCCWCGEYPGDELVEKTRSFRNETTNGPENK